MKKFRILSLSLFLFACGSQSTSETSEPEVEDSPRCILECSNSKYPELFKATRTYLNEEYSSEETFVSYQQLTQEQEFKLFGTTREGLKSHFKDSGSSDTLIYQAQGIMDPLIETGCGGFEPYTPNDKNSFYIGTIYSSSETWIQSLLLVQEINGEEFTTTICINIEGEEAELLFATKNGS